MKNLSHAWYTPERDGSIAVLLSKMNHGEFAMFKGLEQYKLLWNEGFLVPDYSVVRVMWGTRGDEHYNVTQDGKLDGLLANAHSGNEGIHDAKDILIRKIEGEILIPIFEAHNLIPEQRREVRPESLRLK